MTPPPGLTSPTLHIDPVAHVDTTGVLEMVGETFGVALDPVITLLQVAIVLANVAACALVGTVNDNRPVLCIATEIKNTDGFRRHDFGNDSITKGLATGLISKPPVVVVLVHCSRTSTRYAGR